MHNIISIKDKTELHSILSIYYGEMRYDLFDDEYGHFDELFLQMCSLVIDYVQIKENKSSILLNCKLPNINKIGFVKLCREYPKIKLILIDKTNKEKVPIFQIDREYLLQVAKSILQFF